MTDSPKQATEAVHVVAERLAGLHLGHPVRVAVDGICGSGKSTFARSLVAAIDALGRPAVHVDSDGFHHVRARRHRRTDDPARGYYEDAYDLASLADLVLRPLGPGGTRRYATTVHDLRTDEVVTGASAVADPDAVVIVDATFLQAPELDGLWDEAIFLDCDEQTATQRGVARDADALGGTDAARAAYEQRYLAACRIYLREQRPLDRASIVLDTTDPTGPVVVRLGPNGPATT